MQDFFAALISFFLVEPVQAGIADTLATARAPAALLADVTACTRDAAPAIVERAQSDLRWAVASSVGLWIGTSEPYTLLIDVAPSCAAPIAAVRALKSGDT